MSCNCGTSTAPKGMLCKEHLMKDLRNTHFELGTEHGNKHQSVYAKDYPEWKGEQLGAAFDNAALRKTHFVTGVDSMENRFRSIYKEDYIDRPGDMSRLNEENKKDLRSHHFNLGFDKRTPQDNTSEHHSEFIPKEVSAIDRENQKKMKEMVSKSSKIWGDPARYMTSMYTESFLKPEGDPTGRHTKSDIQKQLLQLRSSNILMGRDNPDYTSIFAQDFVRSV